MKPREAIEAYFEAAGWLDGRPQGEDGVLPHPLRYQLEELPDGLWFRRYLSGRGIRQRRFRLISQESYSPEDWQALDRPGYFEALSLWLEAGSRRGNLLAPSPDVRVLGIEALSHGCLPPEEGKAARHQIECRLIYEKE